MSSPDIPPPPPPPQEAKQPDAGALMNKARTNRSRSGMAGGSLLTGPSGALGAPVGRASLLGQ